MGLHLGEKHRIKQGHLNICTTDHLIIIYGH